MISTRARRSIGGSALRIERDLTVTVCCPTAKEPSCIWHQPSRLIPGQNPFGLYLYAENVDELAERMGDLVLHAPETKPWGMYEFALSDPDETLVRVGWPSTIKS